MMRQMIMRVNGNMVLIVLVICSVYVSAAKPVNLALLRPTSQSSAFDVNNCGHLAVDGSMETFWESQAQIEQGSFRPKSQWVKIDLGKQSKIKNISIYWGESYATAFKVQLLNNDASKAINLHEALQSKGGITRIQCNEAEGRFLLIEVSQYSDLVRGCIIREIEVLGDGENRFVKSQTTPLSFTNLSLKNNNWRIQNAMFVNNNPQEIAVNGFNDVEWIPASVPGTILGSYCDFGAFPDPYFADNKYQISDKFFSGNNFWYRTTVKLPALPQNKRLFLHFSGINWKADVYFNAKKLGRIDGAFQRAEFDVTDKLSATGENSIAVLIHHIDNWVSGNHKILKKNLGDRTTNGDMSGLDSPTFVAASGWNWLPIVRGRNTGIWNDVYFSLSGDVTVNDPWVSSKLPALPDTTKAELTIQADVKNHLSKTVQGKLVAKFGKVQIEQAITLNANETKNIVFDAAKYPQLIVKKPKLWWPNGYGQQNIHNLELQFIADKEVTDTKTIRFGIRQIDRKIDNEVLYLYCNGVRLLLRGGNWGLPEAMLRCDSAGYDLRVRLHKEANLNMIRNWVGQTGHKAFYEVCDKYGILVFDDFWLANPVDGPEPSDTAMFMNNVRDKIKWVRKYPSVALYCGRNEGLPPVALDRAMLRETQQLDGTRLYIPHSAAGNVRGFGPYDVRSPQWYFANRGTQFQSEQGIIAFPEAESMRRMLPADKLWPINSSWAIHDYQWGRSEKFTDTIAARFGKPVDLDDYCRRAQLQNYESAKAIFECLQSNQSSGMLLWMSQAAWPSMICQLYDHYFEYTASFFAAKKACSPLHVFWDVLRNEVKVANNTSKNYKNLTVKATVCDVSGKIRWTKTFSTDVLSTSAKLCFVPEEFTKGEVRFLKLELLQDGKPVADNFYWSESDKGNCLALNDLQQVSVQTTVKSAKEGDKQFVSIQLKNTGSQVALLTKLKFKKSKSGDSILPVIFSDNYFSLLPGETKTIKAELNASSVVDESVQLWVEAYNSALQKINL